MIKLENICKNFGDLQVSKNVNLEVREGEKLVIMVFQQFNLYPHMTKRG